jgi:DNA-binding Lrp family transcriptional regulator
MDNSRQTLRQLSLKIGLTAPSIKKRIDSLIEDGFIKEYIVALGNKYIQATEAIILARTEGSVNLEQLITRLRENEIVFLILPMTSGELFLRVMYSDAHELSKFLEMLDQYNGISDVAVHTTHVYEGGGNLSDFTKSQIKILNQLVVDPRMPAHEIAAGSGVSVKKVNQNIDILVKENMIHFGIKWNPHAKGTSVVMNLIEYDPTQTNPDYINDWLSLRYPIEFWYLRVSQEKPIVFAVFGISDIRYLETLTKDIMNQTWTASVSVMIGYSSTNLDTLHITKLIALLSSHGL